MLFIGICLVQVSQYSLLGGVLPSCGMHGSVQYLGDDLMLANWKTSHTPAFLFIAIAYKPYVCAWVFTAALVLQFAIEKC